MSVKFYLRLMGPQTWLERHQGIAAMIWFIGVPAVSIGFIALMEHIGLAWW